MNSEFHDLDWSSQAAKIPNSQIGYAPACSSEIKF
jgi:hypothetical protein